MRYLYSCQKGHRYLYKYGRISGYMSRALFHICLNIMTQNIYFYIFSSLFRHNPASNDDGLKHVKHSHICLAGELFSWPMPCETIFLTDCRAKVIPAMHEYFLHFSTFGNANPDRSAAHFQCTKVHTVQTSVHFKNSGHLWLAYTELEGGFNVLQLISVDSGHLRNHPYGNIK